MTRPPVTLFVSSPSDANAERDAIDKTVRKLNAQNRWRWPPLEVIKWPEDILPGAGSDLQGVINQQLGEFDIFVGVMRSRYGWGHRRTPAHRRSMMRDIYDACDTCRWPITAVKYRDLFAAASSGAG